MDRNTNNFTVADTPEDLSRLHLIDADLLQEIRRDIARTTLPSWMSSPPRNFGKKSHGKLKADQWRTVATVSLVITFVRVWGGPSSRPRDRALLEQFLHLVVAVNGGTRKSLNLSAAENFGIHIVAYLQSLRTMFHHELVPNHHMALHLEDCMKTFGPVQGWWTFPFERYNGMIAGLNSNNKAGAFAVTPPNLFTTI